MKEKIADVRYYPEWVHHELLNWSRWCWRGAYPHPMPEITCASFEKHYSRFSEEGNKDEADKENKILPNAQNAEIVQAVWDKLMPSPQKVLRAEYPQRHESGRFEHGREGAARKLHMSISSYEAALSVASNKVTEAFGERV